MPRTSFDATLLPSRTPRKRAEAVPTFYQCFDTYFKNWFSGDSWNVWRVVAKSIFGEPLTRTDLETFTKFTGRTVAQTEPAREVWLAVGRRGGKDWFTAALLVYLACIRKYMFKAGELGRVMLLACDSDQADVLYEYVTQLIESVPGFESMVAKRSVKYGMRRLQLNNRIEILIKPADRRRVRGRTVLAVVADEVAHWWSDERHANPDTEVLKALRPAMLGVPGALLVAISSPYRRQGAMYEADKKHWGMNGDRVLFWRAATWEMRPDTPGHRAQYPTFRRELEEEKANDPSAFASEYGAEYRLDLEDYLSQEAIGSCVVAGREALRYEPGKHHYLFVDTAGGGGQDSLAACVTRTIPIGAQVCRLFERKPPFDAEAVCDEIAALAAEYNVTMVRGDNFSGATWASMFKQRGLTQVVEKATATVLFRNFAPCVTGKKVELLDPNTGMTQERALNQLVRLEKREGGEKITHPQGEHDDVANALAGAVLMAIRPPSAAIVTAETKSYGRTNSSGPIVDDRGTRYLGDGNFRTASGEVYRDPRYL